MTKFHLSVGRFHFRKFNIQIIDNNSGVLKWWLMEGEKLAGTKSRSSWNEPFSCFAQPLGKVDFNPLKFGRQLQGRIQIIQIKFWEWVNYSLWFRPLFFTSWPPFIFDLHVFTFLFLASFCFGLFLVPSIHSMFDLFLIFISLCCFWIFWPLVFTFTFGILILKQGVSAGVVMLISAGLFQI